MTTTWEPGFEPDPRNDEHAPYFDLIDTVGDALDIAGDLTPSGAARKARIDSHTALRILTWLVKHQYAHTSGNGAWTHYHPGRAR